MGTIAAVLATIFWIYSIIHCANSQNKNKTVWIIIIILLWVVGAIIYFLAGTSSPPTRQSIKNTAERIKKKVVSKLPPKKIRIAESIFSNYFSSDGFIIFRKSFIRCDVRSRILFV